MLQSTFSPLLGVVTLLCVVNMAFVSKSPLVRERLGDAKSKFMGTRILLIAFDMQQKVLDGLVYGSAMYGSMVRFSHHLQSNVDWEVNVHDLSHSDEMSKLW